jgi:hypothetical protein
LPSGLKGGCVTTPDIGVHPDISFEEYKAWDAMNASTLVEGLHSMRRLKAKLDGKLPDKDSDALRFGRAVHCRLLEPERYPFAFPVADQCAKLMGQDGEKRCKNRGKYMNNDGWWCGQHTPAEFTEPSDYVTEEESERVEAIRENAFAHREIQQIRRFKGSEVSLVFDLCGVRCKARIDKWISQGGGFIIDVKTVSRPITEDGWARTIVDLNYHIKAGFYIEGIKACLGIEPEFWHVVIETAAPFDVAAFRLPDFDRQVGAWEVRRILTSYRKCLESNEWPGAFPELVQHVGLPPWKAKQYASMDLED